jgi:hypothetical protein
LPQKPVHYTLLKLLDSLGDTAFRKPPSCGHRIQQLAVERFLFSGDSIF